MLAFISFQTMADVRLARELTYGGYTLLVWDYLLTLDDEVTYIWHSQSSVVKYLFIGNRYLNLLVGPIFISQTAGVLPLHSNTACLTLTMIMSIYQFWSYSSAHSTSYYGLMAVLWIVMSVLVLLRVWILNGRTRKMTITLMVVILLYSSALVVIATRIVRSITFNFDRASSPGSCGTVLPPFSWLIWIVECVMEGCLFGLMIFTLRRQRCPSEFSRVSKLVHSLYRHAVIFFLTNTLGDICNTIMWTMFLGTPLYHISSSLPIALVNITGQRLAIDLRRLHIQKDVTQSEISREIEIQLAAFNDDIEVS